MFRREFLKVSASLPFVGLIPEKQIKETTLAIDYCLNQGRINFYYGDSSMANYWFNGVCEINHSSPGKISIKGKHNVPFSIDKDKNGSFLIGIEKIEKFGLNEWRDCFMLFKMLKCEYLIQRQSFDFSGVMIAFYKGFHTRCPIGQIPERMPCKRKRETVTRYQENYSKWL